MARRSGPAERAWRRCRRNKAAAGFRAASAVASLALVGFFVSLAFHSQLRTAHAETDRQRTIAEGALAREQRFLIYNRIIFAEGELTNNNPYRAEQLLDECPQESRKLGMAAPEKAVPHRATLVPGPSCPDLVTRHQPRWSA